MVMFQATVNTMDHFTAIQHITTDSSKLLCTKHDKTRRPLKRQHHNTTDCVDWRHWLDELNSWRQTDRHQWKEPITGSRKMHYLISLLYVQLHAVLNITDVDNQHCLWCSSTMMYVSTLPVMLVYHHASHQYTQYRNDPWTHVTNQFPSGLPVFQVSSTLHQSCPSC